MNTLKTRNPEAAFYEAMTKIGQATGRPDFAEKTWNMAMDAIFAETCALSGRSGGFRWLLQLR